ncbi:MAG TPA: DUF262 domain-containing protein [Rhodoferax sp.]
MKVNSTSYTVAEYCQQMTDRSITVNRNYQRSNAIWPAAARSFLIDSMLSGFPIPKLSLYQKTDLKTRKTVKEIVDGQQRSQAVLDFFNDELRLSTKGDFLGLSYSKLSEEYQQAFLSYQLSVDVFVDATESDIRELFRRVNSYNVPLNPQEIRHATYQGKFKWFLLEMANMYSQVFKEMGVLSESQMARMEDAKFIGDICVGLDDGIISASEARIDKIYKKYDKDFLPEDQYRSFLQSAIDQALTHRDVLGEGLTKRYQFYCLLLAFIHVKNPIEKLQPVFQSDGNGGMDTQRIRENLSRLAEVASTGNAYGDPELQAFVAASAKTTDRKEQRETRFKAFCRAIA